MIAIADGDLMVRGCLLEQEKRVAKHLIAIPLFYPQSHPEGLGLHWKLLINGETVNSKTLLIHDLILNKHGDLACTVATETWLSKGGKLLLSPQYASPGFEVQNQPRFNGWGDCVAVVYRNKISFARQTPCGAITKLCL